MRDRVTKLLGKWNDHRSLRTIRHSEREKSKHTRNSRTDKLQNYLQKDWKQCTKLETIEV